MKILMNFCRDLHINVDVELSESNAPTAQKQVKEMENMCKDLAILLTHANEIQKKYYDQQHKFMMFQIGNKVLMQAKNFCMIQPSHKLDHRQLGPFTIIDAWGKQAYKLKLLLQYKMIHSVFHVVLLKLYH